MITKDISDNIVEIIKKFSENKSIADLECIQLEEILDSLQFVKVIVALEDEYDIEIPDKYLIPSNLNSVSAMAQMVINIVGGVKCV